MELLLYLVKVSTCTGAFYIFYHLFLKRNTFFGLNRIYLLATLILSFTIPAYTLEIERVSSIPLVIAEGNDHEESLQSGIILNGSGSSLEPTDSTWTWKEILSVIYGSGVTVMGFILFKGLFRVYRLTRMPYTRSGPLKIVQDGSAYTNSSFFNYVFIDLKHLSEAERHAVIAHENVHVMRYHSLDKLLFMFGRIILWFNPFIYAYRKALEEVHEYEADILTAKEYGQAEYACVLLEVSSNKGRVELLNHFAKSQLKNRITMLFKPKSTTMKKLIYLLSVPVVLCMVYGFSVQYVYTYDMPVKAPERGAYHTFSQKGTSQAGKAQPGKQESGRKKIQPSSASGDTIKSVPFAIVSSSRIAGTTSNKINVYDAEIQVGEAKLYSPHVEIDYDRKMMTSSQAKIVSKATTLVADKITVDLRNNTWTGFDHAEAVIAAAVKTLVIDPGHGGKDNAAKGPGGVTEKELNLRAARILKEEAEKRGLKVVMTRTEDTYVSLSDRVQKSGDVFISLHHNSFPVNQKNLLSRGIELVVSSKSTYFEQSKAIANNVLAKLSGLEGIKVRNEMLDRSLLVLKESKSPSFLVELGNVDIASDLAFMRNDDNLRKVCNMILDGVLKSN